MIPALLAKWFGSNWRTDLASAVLIVSGFVAANPGGLFDHYPASVAVAKWIAGGAIAVGLKAAKDGSNPKP